MPALLRPFTTTAGRGVSAARSTPPSRWGRRAIVAAMLALGMLPLVGVGSASAEVTGAADNLRTGWYPDEPSLTPALVSGGSFQQAFKDSLQGQIYAQPLTANGTLLV